ncbi:MAG: 50S ribosomal protein L3 [Thermoplasmata archaeon]
MPRKHKPRHGSMGFSPRKRARSEVPRFSSWPDISDGPRVQGFAGYKAGMTHVLVVDYRKSSTTSGQEVQVPVTVVEVPPMKVAAVRLYKKTPYGLKTVTEIWAQKLDKQLRRRLPVPKKYDSEKVWKKVDATEVDEVRVLVYTQPYLVMSVPKKTPEIMENRIGGGTIEERLEYAKKIIGKEIKIQDFTREGDIIDVAAVTKGKGFGGHHKRWGTKLLSHKDSKKRRGVGTTGSFTPGYTRPTVPQAGQIGYHQRTEYNKRVLKIGEDGEEITPKGGFLSYGVLRNGYVLLHGSIPGPTKRLVRFRNAIRPTFEPVEEIDLKYTSTESKQGA